MGKHGQFDVEVMVTDGNLDRITVLNSRETPGMGDVAMEELTQLIVDNQTLNVDTVSGATLSSMAFIGAVSDALDQAGQKSSDWRKRDKATPAQTELPASAELVKSGDAITGVKVKNTVTGEESTIACKAVVLASGGFGSNIDMRVKYNPAMDDSILSTDSVGATGDGITMGEAAGANLIDMQYIQTYPVCDPETGSLLYVGDVRLESRAIMVNKEGDRFVEELDRRDVLSNAIVEQTDGKAYMLFNQANADETGLLVTHEDEYENLEARKVIVKGDTLEAVCEPFGVDAAELAKTVEKWNQYCKDGNDPDFNFRGDFNAIEGGPYYLMAYKPAVHYTMGGLHINTDAQVLDDADAPIPGLYAAGEVAGHKMGTNRLGSCSMSDIYTFGRIAGKNAAAFSA